VKANRGHLRGISIVEIIAIFILILVSLWTFQLTTLAARQAKLLHWNYIGQATFFILPLVVIFVRRRDPRSYGITVANAGRDAVLGLGLSTAVCLPAVGALAGGWLILRPLDGMSIANALFFQLIFSGFGEELLFRGYFQSHINEEFGRPWRFGAIAFGPGLLVVTLLFGLAHLLNPFNPMLGHFGLDWGSFATTASIGAFLGLVREKSGSLIAPAIVHGSDVLWGGYFMQPARVVFLAAAVGWAIAWFFLIWFSSSQPEPPKNSMTLG
jgi:membrane protease YdiL (CAAX protease family)